MIILQAPFLITEKKRPEKQHRRAKNTKKKPSLQIALLWAMSWHVFADQVPAVDSPVSPTESLEHIIVAPDLDVQLAAHEPQVIDPVAIRFDERGRMWVVEMRDYPSGPAGDDKPISRISILEDHNSDGLFETATVFADNLLFATGVQPWRGGVFVTMAGKVAYMKDTDGDNRANVVETWYTGFTEGNPQLRANHPRLALDNQIYIANGLQGGAIVDPQKPDDEPMSIKGRDFRFDPLTREFEVVSGVGQFGLTFDDYGNRFVCSNRNPVKHIVLEDRYLNKNSLVTVATTIHDVARAGAASRIYPVTRAWTTSNLHAGQFTAACGVEVYRGDLLPKEYYGNVFICEPTGHLIHREIMRPDGVTFTSDPARNGVEFFASRDEWCSPVNLEVGPDGALYVVDMYRAVIEHPKWMPTELQQRKDLLYGNDRGRIYRVVPASNHRGWTAPRLSSLSSVSLVDNLGHPNAWWRETSARLLLERQDTRVENKLRDMALHHTSPVARIHALRAMEGLNLISDELLNQVLEDSNQRVREHAIVTSEQTVDNPSQLWDRILQLTSDEDARVRYQALLTLAPFSVTPTFPTDQWESHALLIAAGNQGGAVLSRWLLDANRQSPSPSPTNLSKPLRLVADLARLTAATKDDQQYALALNALLSNPAYRQIGLTTFLAEASRRGTSPVSIRDQLDAERRREFDDMFDQARAMARDHKQPDSTRCESLDLLALGPDAMEAIVPIALKDPSQAVRLRAIANFSKLPETEPWTQLLKGFSNELPVVRREILNGLFARTNCTLLLIDEIATGRISPTELDRNQINRLLGHNNADIKERAAKLFADAIPADRKQVLADYQVVLKMNPDPHRGRSIFKKHCATCHKIGDDGTDVAPQISDSRTKSPEQYLSDIIQPNRAIDSNYVSYTVITTDGHGFTGILASQTSTSIALKQAEGKTITLGLEEIEELRSNGVSLMPVGLEKGISHQDMADLISFIKNWRYLDGRTPIETH